MKELYETLGIKGNPSTTYHPQTDGQTERVNQSVKEFLTMFVNDKQDDWSDWLVLQTVRTPTLCIPDTSDRPGYFSYLAI